MLENANFAVNVLAAFGTLAAVFVSLHLYWVAQRPDIIAYLSHDRDNGCVLFEVKNLGKGVAMDVKIDSFDFDLVQDKYRDFVRERSFLAKGIPVLVPEACRNTVILKGPEIKNFESVVSKVSLSYKRKRFFGIKTEKCSFPLDYYSFSGSIYTKSDLHKLRVATEVIAGIRTEEQAKRD
jgi:hypothetical protein